MQIRFIDKADFQISGYSVETSLDESSKAVVTGRYFSFKSEDARRRDFEKIADRLNRNLKPM